MNGHYGGRDLSGLWKETLKLEFSAIKADIRRRPHRGWGEGTWVHEKFSTSWEQVIGTQKLTTPWTSQGIKIKSLNIADLLIILYIYKIYVQTLECTVYMYFFLDFIYIN